jgi:DNA repair protein RadC
MSTQLISQHLQYRIPQLKLALIRESEAKASKIWAPDDIEQFVEPMKHFSEEYFVAFHLDAKHHVIGYHEVSHGTISASLVHPREVFKAALLSNAHMLIVAHNHPTGELTPSDEDLKTTQQLVDVGRLLGVSILDHIIVSFRGIKSLREHYPDLFE